MSTRAGFKSNDSSLNMKLQSYDLLTKSKLGYAVIFNNQKFEDKGISLTYIMRRVIAVQKWLASRVPPLISLRSEFIPLL